MLRVHRARSATSNKARVIRPRMLLDVHAHVRAAWVATAWLTTPTPAMSGVGSVHMNTFGETRDLPVSKTARSVGSLVIRKWEIYPIDEPLTLPAESVVIHVGNQNGLPMVWTHDVSANTFWGDRPDYRVQIFGTGMSPPENALHVGTTQMPSGLVWHVFRLDA